MVGEHLKNTGQGLEVTRAVGITGGENNFKRRTFETLKIQCQSVTGQPVGEALSKAMLSFIFY